MFSDLVSGFFGLRTKTYLEYCMFSYRLLNGAILVTHVGEPTLTNCAWQPSKQGLVWYTAAETQTIKMRLITSPCAAQLWETCA